MRPVATTLLSADRRLCELFDVALLDLDGVVYVGSEAVGGAVDALAEARRRGMRLAFVTNNAARPPRVVAEHLTSLGVAAVPDEVITSAQAAAHLLADMLPRGARVLVVGTTGLEEALSERGLVPVHSADDDPAAVVQGYSPDLSWRQLAEGALAIGRGLPWVASNLDRTVPSPRGPLPGNGSMVAALRHATGVEPRATGKPDPSMHRESVQRSGAQRPIVVGDRLDTDVEGADAVGCPSLLVLTGVTDPAELLAAPPNRRPSFLARDLAGLVHTHPVARWNGRAECGRWRVSIGAGGELALSVAPDDADTQDDLDPLRALCVASWHVVDRERPAEQSYRMRVRAEEPDSAAALDALGLG
jgi:glycerol-1-phosphatase